MYQQVYDPVGDSLALSAIFAALPLITLFVLLGGLKWRRTGPRCASLGVALVVAIVVYSMPVGQALDAALLGAVLRPVPDHVDRLERDLDLQHDRRDRALRRAAALVRPRSPTTSASRP